MDPNKNENLATATHDDDLDDNVLASDSLPIAEFDDDDIETPEPAQEPEGGETESGEGPSDEPESVDTHEDDKKVDNDDGEKAESDVDELSQGEGDNEDESPTQNKIPVKRLNQEIEKRRKAEQATQDLEARLKELEQKVQAEPKQQEAEPEAEPEIDLSAKMTEIFNNMLDGDVEKSAAEMAALQQQFSQKAIEDARKAAEESFSTNQSTTRAQEDLNNEAQRIINTYDELNEKSENFDQGIMEDMVRQRDIYIAAGFMPHEALQEAESIMKLKYGLGQTAEVEAAPAPQAKPRIKEKNLEAASKTPPKTTGTNDAQKPKRSVLDMTEAEFDKLTEAELAELRGDANF